MFNRLRSAQANTIQTRKVSCCKLQGQCFSSEQTQIFQNLIHELIGFSAWPRLGESIKDNCVQSFGPGAGCSKENFKQIFWPGVAGNKKVMKPPVKVTAHVK